MTGIFYFTSTGNSLYLAKELQRTLGGEVRYIPRYRGDASEYDRVIIVTPVYSYGMPTFVFDLLPSLNKVSEVTIVQNYGGMTGGADYLAYCYAKKYGLNVRAVYTMKMPENFTVSFTVPKFFLNATLKQAQRRIQKIADRIAAGEAHIPGKRKTKEATYLKNKSNWHIIGQRLSSTERCVKCGKCVSVCPAHNITLKDGKVVFGDSCVACLGCYHRCPEKAIVYQNNRKKDRYLNPLIKESDIGKDFPA